MCSLLGVVYCLEYVDLELDFISRNWNKLDIFKVIFTEESEYNIEMLDDYRCFYISSRFLLSSKIIFWHVEETAFLGQL